MRRPTHDQPRRRPPVTPNMTPMIDVVFLLIIFFLVSSHLARREARLELPLPLAATGQRTADSVARRLTVNVHADGRLLLGATPIAPAALRDRLAAEVARHGDAVRVRVRGDRATPYAAIEPALAACGEAGVVDLGFGVFRAAAE